MYYLEEGAAMNLNCPNEQDPSITRLLPADSDKPLPPNPDLELKAKPGHGGGSNRQSKKKVLSSTGKTVIPQSSISFISGYSFKARGKKTFKLYQTQARAEDFQVKFPRYSGNTYTNSIL